MQAELPSLEQVLEEIHAYAPREKAQLSWPPSAYAVVHLEEMAQTPVRREGESLILECGGRDVVITRN